REAVRQTRIAVAQRLVAQAEAISSQQPALLERGVLLAAESHRRQPSLQADFYLRQSLALLPRPVAFLTHPNPVGAVAFRPHGRTLLTGTTSKDGSAHAEAARAWEVDTGKLRFRLPHDHAGADLGFTQDGAYFASASWDGKARLWDGKSGAQKVAMDHRDPV